ncbi:TOBE domain-containing protein [Streptomyces sp. NPDC048290]|uniref:TOBE domain-containing protein n=1 Tax=Streptomyces sp. NPDC048290 TaxID=3155811 RepID=UPI00344227F0
MNLIRKGSVTASDPDGLEITAGGSRLRTGPARRPVGTGVTLGIRPDDIHFATGDDGTGTPAAAGANLVSGTPVDHHYLGGSYLHRVQTPLGLLTVRSPAGPEAVTSGTVRLRLPAEKLIIMTSGNGEPKGTTGP